MLTQWRRRYYPRSSPIPSVSLRARALVIRPICVSSSVFPTLTMFFLPRALITHLDRVFLSWNACLPPLTVSFRARTLVSYLNRVYSSPNARLPPRPCLFKPERSSPCPSEPERSSPTSTVFLQTRALVSHSHHDNSNPIACLTLQLRPFEPDRSSPTQPCQFKPNRACPTSTISSRARTLIFHLLCQFERNRSSPLPPCPLEPNRSSPASTTSFRARPLVFHPTLRSVMESATPLTQRCCHRRHDVGDTTTMMTMVPRWHRHTAIISATVDGSANMEMKLTVSTSLMARMRMHLRLLTNAEVMDLKARTVSRIPHSKQSVLDTVNHIFFGL